MKLIKPSFEILEQEGYDRLAIEKFIEKCARTCYKSEDKITNDSATQFIQKLINSKHYAMLEHGTVYLEFHVTDPSEISYLEFDEQQQTLNDLINKYADDKYSVVKVNHYYDTCFITTNFRVLVENKWLNDLKYICKPSHFHVKRHTVKFVCNRQVSHEFVRHRVFSFAQESTRYCNYSKGKFGGELTFIEPCWNYKDETGYDGKLVGVLQEIENRYISMINNGWAPQQAATILPNALKTELIMTGFEDDWKHFFDLRADGITGKPHPQAEELAKPLKEEFIKRGYIRAIE